MSMPEYLDGQFESVNLMLDHMRQGAFEQQKKLFEHWVSTWGTGEARRLMHRAEEVKLAQDTYWNSRLNKG